MMVFASGHYSKKWKRWFHDGWMLFPHQRDASPVKDDGECYCSPIVAVQAFIFG